MYNIQYTYKPYNYIYKPYNTYIHTYIHTYICVHTYLAADREDADGVWVGLAEDGAQCADAHRLVQRDHLRVDGEARGDLVAADGFNLRQLKRTHSIVREHIL